MKYVKKPILYKVRVKNGGDTYYTYSHWSTKEIDGVEFITVCKNYPSQEHTQITHLMRKDWLEYIKE